MHKCMYMCDVDILQHSFSFLSRMCIMIMMMSNILSLFSAHELLHYFIKEQSETQITIQIFDTKHSPTLYSQISVNMACHTIRYQLISDSSVQYPLTALLTLNILVIV